MLLLPGGRDQGRGLEAAANGHHGDARRESIGRLAGHRRTPVALRASESFANPAGAPGSPNPHSTVSASPSSRCLPPREPCGYSNRLNRHRKLSAQPDAYAAYAHDAFMLVRRGVLGGRVTRGDMTSYLPTTTGASTLGASGGLGTGRHASRALRLVTLSGETFTPIR